MIAAVFSRGLACCSPFARQKPFDRHEQGCNEALSSGALLKKTANHSARALRMPAIE
jgi:hypothetical protein